jgi:hypothetical protein
MTPSQTIGQVLVSEPGIQLAMSLIGGGLFWWMVRSLRSKLNTLEDGAGGQNLFHARNAILAPRLKGLFGGAGLAVLGFFLLLASAHLVPIGVAFKLFGVAVWLGVALLIFIMIRGAPNFMWRWLLGKKNA